ncbi:hypothetical protein [Methylomarinovum caldicuralii]|uniref:hypothetical protein n=1 Tax=Methylomarinovum caldicuralii TaxID=438856 RepID=UPI0029543642|nr:hypothetical protein [Methylomarinovum caldicuralii]
MPEADLSHLERLNRQLLDCAAAGRWDELRQLARERQALLQALLRRTEGQEAAAWIQRAVAVDRTIIRLRLRRRHRMPVEFRHAAR